jgi:hypothetical protein
MTSRNTFLNHTIIWQLKWLYLPLLVLLLLVSLGGCQKRDSGGSTAGNPLKSALPQQISIDAF